MTPPTLAVSAHLEGAMSAKAPLAPAALALSLDLGTLAVSAAEHTPGGGLPRTMPPSTVIPELVYEDVGEARV